MHGRATPYHYQTPPVLTLPRGLASAILSDPNEIHAFSPDSPVFKVEVAQQPATTPSTTRPRPLGQIEGGTRNQLHALEGAQCLACAPLATVQLERAGCAVLAAYLCTVVVGFLCSAWVSAPHAQTCAPCDFVMPNLLWLERLALELFGRLASFCP